MSEGPAGQRRYDLLGSAVSIDPGSEELAARVHRLLGPFSAVSGDAIGDRCFSVVDNEGGAGHYELCRGEKLLLRSAVRHEVLNTLIEELNRHALDGFTGFAVHAGVVAAGSGAVAFPASSGDGKSTLAAACLAAGFDYVSDEALCVGFDAGSVQPYAKPIQLSPASRGILGLALDGAEPGTSGLETSFVAGDLGARVASPPLALGHVVRIQRRPGAPVLSEVPSAQACGWLLRYSFNHHKRPLASFDLAADLAARATAWNLQYDQAPEAARLLAERLGTDLVPARAPLR